MNAEEVRRAKDQAPFKPFILFLSEQRRFEIRHPDFLWVVPGGRTIGVADEHGTVEIIDTIHITSIQLNGDRQS